MSYTTEVEHTLPGYTTELPSQGLPSQGQVQYYNGWGRNFLRRGVDGVDLIKLLYLLYITKTWLYKFDPLKPLFNRVKLGFTDVYIIFLTSAQKHRL